MKKKKKWQQIDIDKTWLRRQSKSRFLYINSLAGAKFSETEYGVQLLNSWNIFIIFGMQMYIDNKIFTYWLCTNNFQTKWNILIRFGMQIDIDKT